MIEQFAKWAGPIMALLALGGSWQLIQYRQAAQERKDEEIGTDLERLTLRINELEKREGIADAKRADMVRILEENRADVKAILQEIAKLATMISLQGGVADK